jgi:hypothetical protein
MRKGNVVRIVDGMWTFQTVILRPTTLEEKEAWRNSPESKGINSAGETKLPPQIVSTYIKGDTLMVVEKARCAPLLGWYKYNGMTKVKVISGENVGKTGYIKRDQLAIV